MRYDLMLKNYQMITYSITKLCKFHNKRMRFVTKILENSVGVNSQFFSIDEAK